jgi:purine-nucleoside phosphorylase
MSEPSPTELHPLVAPLERARDAWFAAGRPRIDAVVVSGSGLGVDFERPSLGPLPLADLLPFPLHAVAGHALDYVIFEPVPGRHVLYYRGRIHTYQGYDAHQATFLVRLAALLGAQVLWMTNAAGGLRPTQKPGQLVLLSDHINLSGSNPLRGELPLAWGPRFPGMADAYDANLRRLARAEAARLGIDLAEGVYVGLAGPSYETPAEVKMLGLLGGDVVGMSTVLEVIAARHLGVRCGVISLITNVAAAEGLDHEEVLTEGRLARERVQRLLGALLAHADLLPPRTPDPRAPA